eukprot:692304-Pelagomonas_calceolata.AAC.1
MHPPMLCPICLQAPGGPVVAGGSGVIASIRAHHTQVGCANAHVHLHERILDCKQAPTARMPACMYLLFRLHA